MNLNWRLYTNTTLQFYKIADNVDRFLWLDSMCAHMLEWVMDMWVALGMEQFTAEQEEPNDNPALSIWGFSKSLNAAVFSVQGFLLPAIPSLLSSLLPLFPPSL